MSKWHEPSLALVFGYLPGLDRMDKTARQHGLCQRLSIALDSYNPELGEMYFDYGMYQALLAAIAGSFSYDSVSVSDEQHYTAEKGRCFKSVREALGSVSTGAAGGGDPCSYMAFFWRNELVCFVETISYASFGGADPYHDTYCFAVYQETFAPDTEAMLTALCRRHGYRIRAIVQGGPEPRQTLGGWLRRHSL